MSLISRSGGFYRVNSFNQEDFSGRGTRFMPFLSVIMHILFGIHFSGIDNSGMYTTCSVSTLRMCGHELIEQCFTPGTKGIHVLFVVHIGNHPCLCHIARRHITAYLFPSWLHERKTHPVYLFFSYITASAFIFSSNTGSLPYFTV